MVYGSGLSHADEAAAFVYPFADGSNQRFVQPLLAAGESSACIAGVDDDVHIGRHAVFADIVETQEYHVNGSAA